MTSLRGEMQRHTIRFDNAASWREETRKELKHEMRHLSGELADSLAAEVKADAKGELLWELRGVVDDAVRRATSPREGRRAASPGEGRRATSSTEARRADGRAPSETGSASGAEAEACAQLEGLLELEAIPARYAAPLLAAGATAPALLRCSKPQLGAWAREAGLPMGHRLKLQSAVTAAGGSRG